MPDDTYLPDNITDGPDPGPTGGLSVRSGMTLDEIATVRGPGNDCGRDRPLGLADTTGDGIPEVALGCDPLYEQDPAATELYVLDGATTLDSHPVQLGLVEVSTHGFNALGDLDGDGQTEIGFGNRNMELESGSEVVWWTLIPGAAVTANTNLAGVGVDLVSSADQYGNGAPCPVGDADGDGVDDLVVWQLPGSGLPAMHLVSGALAIWAGGLSVDTSALRTYGGLGVDEVPTDVVVVGDADDDGQPDLAVALGGHTGQQGSDQVPTVVVAFGDTLDDPDSTTRILGNSLGVARGAQVEVLGDLDGDGLPELVVLLTNVGSTQPRAELAVIPSGRLGQTGIIDPAPYALGGIPAHQVPRWMEVCDLDGDGLPELVLDAGTWDGRDLLTPGALPVGSGVSVATCAGDLDGMPGDEILVGGDPT